MVPSTIQTESTNKVLPDSHEWATSLPAKESGRKTDRIPWVNHLSGNIEAKSCIHFGRLEKIKKTPLKNCKTITIGETTAEAPRPLLGTLENAIPRMVEQMLPRITNHANLNQRSAEVGTFKPKSNAPNTRRSPT